MHTHSHANTYTRTHIDDLRRHNTAALACTCTRTNRTNCE